MVAVGRGEVQHRDAVGPAAVVDRFGQRQVSVVHDFGHRHDDVLRRLGRFDRARRSGGSRLAKRVDAAR